MADSRKPVRPEGEEGANWVHCECGREAPKLKLIRHTKHCDLNPVTRGGQDHGEEP